MGSIDQAIRPFFHFHRYHHPAIYSNPYLPAYDAVLEAPTVDMELRNLLPRLADVLSELRNFSNLTEQTLLKRHASLNPIAFVEACYSVQHGLLSSGPVRDISDDGSITRKNDLEEAFRLGAIIYIKEILRGLSFSATGSRILVSKLKTSLSGALASRAKPTLSSLLLWLLIMGGVASIKNSTDRALFVAHLVRLGRELGLEEWADVKERLEGVLWIGLLLDKAGTGLWEEVELTDWCMVDVM